MFSVIIYKSLRKIGLAIKAPFDYIWTIILLKGNNVQCKSFDTCGIPYIMVARGGTFSIDDNFSMNNGIIGNPIGCYDKCTFFVDRGAKLRIGKSVGISQTAIICHQNITIDDYVKIGGGVKIYDTDFHSLDPVIRRSIKDLENKTKADVHIKSNAFIGANSIILKGVIIGENSIIGAGSVVTKSVPDNQIWGGNPAKFIREI